MKLATRHYRLHGKAATALLLTVLVLLLGAMSACPALHELVHKDADCADHQCAVTMFAHGQVNSVVVDVAPVEPSAVIETTGQFTFSAFTPAIENLPAGRAPPVFSVVS